MRDWSPKDPDDIRDYSRGFDKEFPTDTIASLEVLVPDDLTVVSSSLSGKTATARLSGGAVNKSYQVTFRLTFADGQQVDRSETLLVRNR
jgi:hypothetical protein